MIVTPAFDTYEEYNVKKNKYLEVLDEAEMSQE